MFVPAVMLSSVTPFTPTGIVWPEWVLSFLANTLHTEARASCIGLKAERTLAFVGTATDLGISG